MNWLAIALTMLMSTQSWSAQVRCEDTTKIFSTEPASTDLFISQENPLFYKYHLLDKGQPSQLCGITSLANFINLILGKKNQSMSPSALVDFISTQSQNFADDQLDQGNRHFKLKGMYPYDLADLSKALLKKLKLKITPTLRTELFDNQEVRPEDLPTSLGSIWAISFVPKNPEADGADHFVLILNYDAATRTLDMLDPLESNKIKHAKVVFPGAASADQHMRVEMQPGSDMKDLIGETEGYFILTSLINFSNSK